MELKYNIIRKVSKGLAKKLNLEFDPKFGYYVGDTYNDSKGNSIPNYFYFNGIVYSLKYFDGCFNPYLVQYIDKDRFILLIKGKEKQVFPFDGKNETYNKIEANHEALGIKVNLI